MEIPRETENKIDLRSLIDGLDQHKLYSSAYRHANVLTQTSLVWWIRSFILMLNAFNVFDSITIR